MVGPNNGKLVRERMCSSVRDGRGCADAGGELQRRNGNVGQR